MANAGEKVSGLLGDLFSGFLDISATVIIAILITILIGAVLYYFIIYRRKFDIFVKVISERAQDPRVYFDKAAILKDKKGNKFFRILKTKVELEVPPFKVIERTNQGDYLELWRKSEDQFIFLTTPKIDKTQIIKANGKSYPVGRTSQTSIESDLYWISKRREENKRLLDPESLFMKLLAWAPQIISSMFLLIILWIFMDKIPDLINQLVELTRELRSLKGATLTG